MTLRWALADSMTVAGRELRHWRAEPAPVVIGLLFPVMVVLMFGYLFGGAMAVPDGADYLEYLLPGVFALTMVFGLEATMTAVAGDVAKGVTDRFRSLPMASPAVLAGRCAADLLSSTLGLAVLIGFGFGLGWRWHHGWASALLAVGLLLWLRFALLWVGIYLGLVVKGPEAVVTVQILVWPLGFLANTFVSPTTMPGWLAVVAEWNPLSATVAAVRDLFGNPAWQGGSWIAEHSLPMAVIWPALITAVFHPLAVRRYRRLHR